MGVQRERALTKTRSLCSIMSEELIEIVLIEADEQMAEALAAVRREFSKVRTGRANSALLERLPVEAYGVVMSMQELVSFSVPEASQLIITPHDVTNVGAVERAIQKSRLGLSASNDGRVIRLSFPPLTEQRRKELVRLVGSMAETSRNQIRNLRRAARKDLDDIEKDGGISSDAVARAVAEVDTLTRRYENRIEQARVRKEEELLDV